MHRGKINMIFISYGYIVSYIILEKVNVVVIQYQNTISMVRSSGGNTLFFKITIGNLQIDTIAPFMYIIYIYILFMIEFE